MSGQFRYGGIQLSRSLTYLLYLKSRPQGRLFFVCQLFLIFTTHKKDGSPLVK